MVHPFLRRVLLQRRQQGLQRPQHRTQLLLRRYRRRFTSSDREYISLRNVGAKLMYDKRNRKMTNEEAEAFKNCLYWFSPALVASRLGNTPGNKAKFDFVYTRFASALTTYGNMCFP